MGKTRKTIDISLQSDGETITEPVEVANQFNNYFSKIADNIRDTLPAANNDFKSYLPRRGPSNSFYFNSTGVYETQSVLKKLKSKDSCGIDGISSKVLKSLPNNFIEPLTYVFNQSMSQGYFPSHFKSAKIVPIYKKKGSRKSEENYRPISLLCSMSKVLEKLVHKRVSKFLEKMNFFPNTQFGFRKSMSTSHAISLLVNTITKSMNKKKKNAWCLFGLF